MERYTGVACAIYRSEKKHWKNYQLSPLQLAPKNINKMNCQEEYNICHKIAYYSCHICQKMS